MTITTRAWPSTFRRCGTSCRSHPTPTGLGCSPRARSFTAICATPPVGSACTTICKRNTEVLQQKWDDTAGIWRLAIKDRPAVTARFVISSVGGYVNAKTATDIDGVDDFVGTILRPNAWDDGYDARGQRIAVIGTGSSGVQIAAALSAESREPRRVPADTGVGATQDRLRHSAVAAQDVPPARRHRQCQHSGSAGDGCVPGRPYRAPAASAAQQAAHPDHAALRCLVPGALPPAVADRGR